jgi:propanediol dehydratase small subunit
LPSTFRQDIAAIICAVADQVDAVNVPDHILGDAYWPYRNGRAAAKEHLIAIANELEGSNA